MNENAESKEEQIVVIVRYIASLITRSEVNKAFIEIDIYASLTFNKIEKIELEFSPYFAEPCINEI